MITESSNDRYRSRKFGFAAATWITSHALLISSYITSDIYFNLMLTIIGLYATGSVAEKWVGGKS